MGASQLYGIPSWIEEVSRSLQQTPLNADRLEEFAGDPTTPPLTPEGQHKRKRTDSEFESSISQPEPAKKPRGADSTPASVHLLDDTSPLLPPSSVASRSVRSRSSSPDKVKGELAAATPRIIYIRENGDPGASAAKELLATLTADTEFFGNQEAIQNIYTASDKCAAESRSEGSWLYKVAIPLLEEAIGNLPLECWSVYVFAKTQYYTHVLMLMIL